MGKQVTSNDLKINCKRWAIQSEILKVGDMEYLESIHEYIKVFIRRQNETGLQDAESGRRGTAISHDPEAVAQKGGAATDAIRAERVKAG